MKKPYRDHVTYVRKKEERSHNNMKSETIQGESMSVKELIAKESAGNRPPRKNVMYMEVENIDQVTDFHRPLTDLTDIQEVIDHTNELTERIKIYTMEKEKADEAIQLKLEKEQKEKVEDTKPKEKE